MKKHNRNKEEEADNEYKDFIHFIQGGGGRLRRPQL
jgi:hypothetical protein